MIKNGDRVKDKITGFVGIVICEAQWKYGCEAQWMYGCRRLTVQGEEIKDGKYPDKLTFDEPQLILLKTAEEIVKLETGGPRPELPRPSVSR